MSTYAIGLDYGTETVRAVLVDTANGETAATAVESYADGVIASTLPGTGRSLPPEWAFAEFKLPITSLVAGGGLSRDRHVMQVYADVCGRDVSVAGSTQTSALGAAILGAVARVARAAAMTQCPKR